MLSSIANHYITTLDAIRDLNLSLLQSGESHFICPTLSTANITSTGLYENRPKNVIIEITRRAMKWSFLTFRNRKFDVTITTSQACAERRRHVTFMVLVTCETE
jgi:CHAT domain-containing protein